MSNPFREDVSQFLQAFLAPPNRLTLEGDQRLGLWVELLRGSEPRATILPCWRGGKTVDWYGIATKEPAWRALGEDLMAFIGPTLTTFRGQRAVLNDADPIDA